MTSLPNKDSSMTLEKPALVTSWRADGYARTNTIVRNPG